MDPPPTSSADNRNGDDIPVQTTLDSHDKELESDTKESPAAKATWRHIFAFMERQHVGVLILATVMAACAAGLKTSNAIFLGKFLDIDTQIGNGSITMKTAFEREILLCILITAVGAASWLCNWTFMTAWIIFGELTAKSAREKVFTTLLYKDMSWFDSQAEGMSSALSSIQM